MRPVRALLPALLLALALPALPVRAARAQDLTCDPGDVEVRSLAFAGNHAFTDAELASAIVTTPSSWWYQHFRFGGTRRCLDRTELPRDVLRLRYLYHRRGYYGAQVDTSITPDGPGAVDVEFRIVEGEPVRIDTLTIQGLDSLPPPARARTLRALPLAVGDVFDQLRLQATVDTITSRLVNNGYPKAQVLKDFSVDTVDRTATVNLTVSPGTLARIGRIDVTVEPAPGKSQQIPDRVVRRLLGIHPGAIYRERNLVQAQRNLYQTDAYRHVEVRLAPDSAQPRGDSLVVIEAVLAEGAMHSADVGLGWGTLDCVRTRGQYLDRNFLNGARQLEVNARMSKIGNGYPMRLSDAARSKLCPSIQNDPYSDTLNYRVDATVRQPAFLGTRYVPSLTIYSERTSEYLAYLHTAPIGGLASVSRDLGRGMSLGLNYQLDYGHTVAQPALFCAVFNVCQSYDIQQLSEKNRRLAVASVTLTRDRRDEPLNPVDGTLTQLEFRHASHIIGSDPTLEFNKWLVDAAWYRGVLGNVLAARLRLAGVLGNDISLRGGLSLGGARGFIPPQERLYAGGPTTVRGFHQNELGPVVYVVENTRIIDTTDAQGRPVKYVAVAGDSTGRVVAVPVGGNSLIVGNLEYRMRDPFLPDLIQWTVFMDVGTVWNRGQEAVTLGSLQSLLRWTPGVGTRLLTRFGAIRVDVGYNPYPRVPGAAYYEPPISATNPGTSFPLYCVSPGNRLPVTTRGASNDPSDLQSQVAGACPSTFAPTRASGFFRRLTFNFSIGQAF